MYIYIYVLIFILIVYILLHQFFTYRNVSHCKNSLNHPKKINEINYSDIISSYNPSLFMKDNELNIAVRECTSGSNLFNLDSFLKISNLKILDKNLKIKNKITAKFNKNFIKDIRIFNHNNTYVGIASIGHKIPKPVLLKFDDNITEIKSVHLLESDDTLNDIPSKNWILINDNLIHTDTYPEFKVQQIVNYKLTEKYNSKDEIQKIFEKNFIFNEKITKIHGGCNWIKLNNGNYLTIVHTLIAKFSVKELRRIYRNMLLEIDSTTFKIVKYSNWICFSNKCECIQFVSSMIKINDIIKIGMGINDSFVKIVNYKEEELTKLLKPI